MLYRYYSTKQDNAKIATTTQEVQSSPTPGNPTPPPAAPETSVKTYTMEEVVKHGPESWDNEDLNPDDACWMVIRGKVYAIPDSFTQSHPGGHAIYDGCGTDATTLFETRPSGSGKPHSENARSILEKFYIGDLKK